MAVLLENTNGFGCIHLYRNNPRPLQNRVTVCRVHRALAIVVFCLPDSEAIPGFSSNRNERESSLVLIPFTTGHESPAATDKRNRIPLIEGCAGYWTGKPFQVFPMFVEFVWVLML